MPSHKPPKGRSIKDVLLSIGVSPNRFSAPAQTFRLPSAPSTARELSELEKREDDARPPIGAAGAPKPLVDLDASAGASPEPLPSLDELARRTSGGNGSPPRGPSNSGGGSPAETPKQTIGHLLTSGTRFIAVAIVEFGVLRFVEEPPVWFVGLTVLLAILFLAVLENRERVQALNRGLFVWTLALLFLLYGAAVIFGLGYFGFNPVGFHATQTLPPEAARAVPMEAPKRAKYYSNADKNRLSDITYALRTDLTDNAMNAVGQTAALAQMLSLQIQSLNRDADISPQKLRAKLNEIRALLSAHEKIADDLLSQNDVYRDELSALLGNNGPNALNLFREALEPVDLHIVALEVTNQNGANINIGAAILRSMQQSVGAATASANQFGAWINQSRNRIDEFRRGLRQ